MKTTIMLIDTSPTITKVLKISLSRFAIKLLTSETCEQALQSSAGQKIDLMIVDSNSKDIQSKGKDLTTKFSAILLHSSFCKEDNDYFVNMGFKHILQKPFNVKELFLLLNKIGTSLSPGESELGITTSEQKKDKEINHSLLLENNDFKIMLTNIVKEELQKKIPIFVESFCRKHFKKEVEVFLKKELNDLTTNKLL
jgi:DNA-binding response OmpR family regulator